MIIMNKFGPQNVPGVVEFVFNPLHEPIHTLFGVPGVLVWATVRALVNG